MSEFCKQCTERLFGDDPIFNDAKGLISEAEVGEGYLAPFLCAGCGPTLVDNEGSCVTDCFSNHRKQRGAQSTAARL